MEKHWNMTHLFKLLLLLSCFVAIQGQIKRLPIHRDRHALKSMGSVLGLQQFVAKKHNMDLGEYTPCADEIDTFNATFYAYVFVGTPFQQVKVNFDTTHTSLVVSSSQFDVEKSKTAVYYFSNYYLEDPFTYAVDYQHTESIYTDYVGVGGIVIDQNIPVFESSIGEFAIFGLGVNGSQSDIVPPIKTMYNAKAIDSQVFSMYLVNEDNSSAPEFAGEILFGESDPNAYIGSLNYINLIELDELNFPFNIEQVSINGESITTQVAAIIDSGSQFISTPLLPYALINAQLGGVTDNNGHYFVNCSTLDTLPTLDITIAGQTLSIKSSSYILKIMDEHEHMLCMSAFLLTSTKYWVLGTPIMVDNYFEFDVTNQRIGWAPAATYNGTLSVSVPTAPQRQLPKKICK